MKTPEVINKPQANTVPAKRGFKPLTCFTSSIIGVLCNSLIFYLSIINKYSENPSEGIEFLTGLTLAFLALFTTSLALISLYLFIKFMILIIKSLRQRPLVTVILLGFVMIGLVFSLFIYKKSSYYLSNDSFMLIHKEMSSLYYLRSIRDDLAAGKTVLGWDNEKLKAEFTNLDYELWGLGFDVPELYDPYYTALAYWYIDMSDAINGNIPWEEVSTVPMISEVSLDMWQLDDSYSRSLNRVAALKEAGDLMISTNNREGMRVVAAELSAEVYWLENLTYTIDPGLLGYEMTKVQAIDKAAGNVGKRQSPCLNRNGISFCSNQATGLVQGVQRSAMNYTAGDPAAAASWTSSWEPLATNMSNMGRPIPESGITVSDDPNTYMSPRLQAFYSNCEANGGIVGGSGGVMERLPVATSGWTCWYGKDKQCWDFLTYTNGRYAGGPSGANCAERGLLPLPVPNFFDAITQEVQAALEGLKEIDLTNTLGGKWDGNYTFTISGTNCQGMGTGAVDIGQYLNGDGFLIVSGNRIVNYDQGSIDEDGHAVSVFNPPGTSITVDVIFSQNNGIKSYMGTYHARQVIGQFVSFDCKGSVSGQEE